MKITIIYPPQSCFPFTSTSGNGSQGFAKLCNSCSIAILTNFPFTPYESRTLLTQSSKSLLPALSSLCSSCLVMVAEQGRTHLGFQLAVEDARNGPAHEWASPSACRWHLHGAFPGSTCEQWVSLSQVEAWGKGKERSSALWHEGRMDGVGTLYLPTLSP